MTRPPHPFDFLGGLVWLDGRPLMNMIEPYRQRAFEAALYTFDADGLPRYNRVVIGRGKKNFKSSDLILSAFYKFFAWPSAAGNDVFIVASDEEQAGDDLSLAKKLVAVNPVLDAEVDIFAKEIVRKDGQGRMKILPAQDVAGLHGKTFLFAGHDEIHNRRNYDIFEALSPDPSRPDALVWITSYAPLRSEPGIPITDLFRLGQSGGDPRMYFQWYSGSYTTDPDFAGDDVTPEQRANPSMANWGDGGRYLADQRLRLPPHRFRRLHLNEPGAPDNAALDADVVDASMVPGRLRLPPRPGVAYYAFVDMSGGGPADAVLAIAHFEEGRSVVDLITAQDGRPPFNPRHAVKKFAGLLQEYGIGRVMGDRFAGETFAADFRERGIAYEVSPQPRAGLYDVLAARLNAGEVELPLIATLREQLCTLVLRPNGQIDRVAGDLDDWANATAGVIATMTQEAAPALLSRATILPRGATEPGGAYDVYAVLWRTLARGDAGAAYFAVQTMPLAGDPVVHILDLDYWPQMSVEVFPAIVDRLDTLIGEASARYRGRMARPFLWVPPEWAPRAGRLLDERFYERFAPMLSRLNRVPYGVSVIASDWLRRPEDLLTSAHAHWIEGRVGVTAAALRKGEAVPWVGALAWRPGSRDRIEDDASRAAVLLGVVLGLDNDGAVLDPAVTRGLAA